MNVSALYIILFAYTPGYARNRRIKTKRRTISKCSIQPKPILISKCVQINQDCDVTHRYLDDIIKLLVYCIDGHNKKSNLR